MDRSGAGPVLGPWAGLAGGGGGVTKMSLGECKGAGMRATRVGMGTTGTVLSGAWGGLGWTALDCVELIWAGLCEAAEATVLGPTASVSLLNTEAAVSRLCTCGPVAVLLPAALAPPRPGPPQPPPRLGVST